MKDIRHVRQWCAVGVFVLGGCRASGLWTVGAPVNEVTEETLNSPTGAQQALVGAEWQFTTALYGRSGGVVLPAELLSDEYTQTVLSSVYSTDARFTSAEEQNAYDEPGNDGALSNLLLARSALLVTVPYLAANEVAPNQGLTGQALALAGYAELFMAEDYCAGVPLTQAVVGGGVSFGAPLTMDSLLGVAEQHFRQALAASYEDSTVINLASEGLGRALVDRGRFDTAAVAVATVPLGFVYNLYGLTSNNSGGTPLYWKSFSSSSYNRWASAIIANDEGESGNNYITSGDQRLVLTSIGSTIDRFYQDHFYRGAHFPDTLLLWPVKFGSTASAFTAFPLATGIEARLIAAEDSFWNGSGASVYPYLSTLRQEASQTYIQATSPVPILGGDTTGTCTGKGDTLCTKALFRERAFWLFGTGTRLGDMRREERQYGLADMLVFPHGPYLRDSTDSAYLAQNDGFTLQQPWATYGTDVSLSLPTAASGQTTINPHVTPGCLAPATTQTP